MSNVISPQHEDIAPVLDEAAIEFADAARDAETVEIEFKGPFTVKRAPLAALILDAEGEVVGHLVDVPGCSAFDLGATLIRVINDEADRITQAMLALWELGNTIGELQEAEAHLPADQRNPALARIAAQWNADAADLVADGLAFHITDEGEVVAKTLVDDGSLPR